MNNNGMRLRFAGAEEENLLVRSLVRSSVRSPSPCNSRLVSSASAGNNKVVAVGGVALLLSVAPNALAAVAAAAHNAQDGRTDGRCRASRIPGQMRSGSSHRLGRAAVGLLRQFPRQPAQ